jgi:hypothetical protein
MEEALHKYHPSVMYQTLQRLCTSEGTSKDRIYSDLSVMRPEDIRRTKAIERILGRAAYSFKTSYKNFLELMLYEDLH